MQKIQKWKDLTNFQYIMNLVSLPVNKPVQHQQTCMKYGSTYSYGPLSGTQKIYGNQSKIVNKLKQGTSLVV